MSAYTYIHTCTSAVTFTVTARITIIVLGVHPFPTMFCFLKYFVKKRSSLCRAELVVVLPINRTRRICIRYVHIYFSASSSLEYGSVPGGSSIFPAGTVDEDKYEKLLDNLSCALAKAAQRHGDQRTAAGGKQGAPFKTRCHASRGYIPVSGNKARFTHVWAYSVAPT